MESSESERKSFLEVLNKSPMYRHIGMEVIDAKDGKSKLILNAKKELQSLYGMVHGGAIASVIDSACSIAAGTQLAPGEICLTVDLRTNYIANLKEGKIFAEGILIHRGAKTCVSRAEARDENGNLIAVGIATLLVCSYEDVHLSK
ncbi:MAG: PaaI family thioesterase [Actinomycetota bacterium]|nr:PaaI family thioesterase [Actinomycetota bacterium]